ncbi:hypothetical protein ACR2XN_28650, partial [Klebsiella pneumoniae]
MKSLEAATSQLKIEEIVEDETEEEKETKDDEETEDEFYTLEELDGLKNSSYAFMARKFPNLRFKKNQPFRAKPKKSFFNKGKGPMNSGKEGYKTGTVERSIQIGYLQCKKNSISLRGRRFGNW